MQVFQDFDPDEQKNPETRVSIPEKALILGFTTVLNVAARKARKAKTYGDLYKIMRFIETRMDKADGKFEKLTDADKKPSDENLEKIHSEMVLELQEVEQELEEL